MRVLRTKDDIRSLEKGGVLTIGNFDGMHIGHQAILSKGRKIADSKGTSLTVMTFEPHPLARVSAKKAPASLTPLPLKENLLAGQNVDYLIILESEPGLLSMPAEDFIEQYIVKNLKPVCIVEGDDFNFGAARAGNIDTLKILGSKFGFDATVVKSVIANLPGSRSLEVSSTVIRQLIDKGEIGDAAVLLGRPYRLIGPIVSGRGRGRQIGFPTANMAKHNQLVPAEGVYAGFVQVGKSEKDVCVTGQKIPAAMSIGKAPTYSLTTQLIEAHLLTKNVGDLSGQWIAMDFIQRLRDQRKFASEEELIAQIARDCEMARQILSS